jgi:hypothetical protein
MNANNPLVVYSNAIKAVQALPELLNANKIYLVGVSHGA